MNLKDLKLRAKFTIAFGLIIVFIIALLILANIGLTKVNQSVKATDKNDAISQNLNSAYSEQLNTIINIQKSLLSGNVNEITVNSDFASSSFGKWMQSADKTYLESKSSDLKNKFLKAEDAIKNMAPIISEINAILKKPADSAYNPRTEAQNTFVAKMQPVIDGLNKNFDEIASETKQILSSSNAEILNIQQRVQTQIIIFGIIIIIIALISAYVFTISFIVPFKKGVEFANKIASGDLTATINISRKDELGELMSALQHMVAKLLDIVNNIKSGAENISTASLHINTASQSLSQGVSEQASSAEEVSSSMEEMAANIQQNTENAQQTEKIALKAAKDIKEGSSAVNITVDSMKVISEKISIIGEIARQTNILALNAAIEAARAGEHGKGFAVVAAEVRKLAERSQVAAAEIDEVSKSSVDIADKSRGLLEEIVPDIERTAKLVQEITAASIEQTSGTDQINNAIQQLNNITQQNAATSEEMATNAEELSDFAEQLKDTISFFKIDHKMKSKMHSLNLATAKKAAISIKPKVKPIEKKQTTEPKVTIPKKGFSLNMGKKDMTDVEFEKF